MCYIRRCTHKLAGRFGYRIQGKGPQGTQVGTGPGASLSPHVKLCSACLCRPAVQHHSQGCALDLRASSCKTGEEQYMRCWCAADGVPYVMTPQCAQMPACSCCASLCWHAFLHCCAQACLSHADSTPAMGTWTLTAV